MQTKIVITSEYFLLISERKSRIANTISSSSSGIKYHKAPVNDSPPPKVRIEITCFMYPPPKEFDFR